LLLVHKNRILTKDNLLKKKRLEDPKCIFYGEDKTVHHLFVKCSIASCLWLCICNYNNYNSINDLWFIDVLFSYKNIEIYELVKGGLYLDYLEEKESTNF
jgi:zinc-binding in reverse transcriptase